MKRFWDKVEKTDTCWNWTAAKSAFGHGRFRMGRKLVSPHRLVYEWEHGEIPEGYDICHHCDNPSCVNPQHLFLGTRSDNMKDAMKKNRLPQMVKILERKGSETNNAKLTEKEVLLMRALEKKGMKTKELSKRFGITRRNVRDIIYRRTWTHI